MGILDYLAATSPRQAEHIRNQKRRRELAKIGHTPASFNRLHRMETTRVDRNRRGVCAAGRCTNPIPGPNENALVYCSDACHDRDQTLLHR